MQQKNIKTIYLKYYGNKYITLPHWGAAMSATKFVTARNAATGELVTLPEVRAQFFKAAAQSPEAVKDLRKAFKMVCPHCDPHQNPAAIHFNFASEKPDGTLKTIAGQDIIGNRANLRTNPKALHTKGCTAVVLSGSNGKVDESKGYRIHVNIGEIPERSPRNRRLIIRNGEGRIIILDPDLKTREPWELSKPDKIIPLLKSGQFARIHDSVAVYGSQKIAWDDFFVHRQTKDDPDLRMRGFMGRLLAGDHVPALIDLEFDARVSVCEKNNKNGKYREYKFPKVTGVIHPESGREVTVIPRICVNNEYLFGEFTDIHRARGEMFLLTRDATIFKSSFARDTYIMYIDIADPAMITRANLRGITCEGRKNEAKRAEILAASSSAPAAK